MDRTLVQIINELVRLASENAALKQELARLKELSNEPS